MSFADVEAAYRRWLYLDHDQDIIKILFGTILGNSYDGPPIWLLIVGPPGAGKTVLVKGLKRADCTVFVSNLTPASLASGSTGTGFLDDLNGKMMIVPDFSAINAMPRDTRHLLFGFFRDAYDGSFTRITGRDSRPITWEGQFGMIGCSTPHATDEAMKEDQELGERFLLVRTNIEGHDLDQILDAAYDGAMVGSSQDLDIQGCCSSYLNTVQLPAVVLDGELRQFIINSARVLAWSRSPVIRDGVQREISFPVWFTREVPTRLVKQLRGLATGLQAIGCDADQIRRMIRRVSRDTVPIRRLLVLRCVANGITSKKEICERCGMHNSHVYRIVEELERLELLIANKMELRLPELREVYKEQQ